MRDDAAREALRLGRLAGEAPLGRSVTGRQTLPAGRYLVSVYGKQHYRQTLPTDWAGIWCQ